MADRIRIIPHEAVPLCGSFEVRFPDGRPSRFFYRDDIAGRRLRPDLVGSATAKAGGAIVCAVRAERVGFQVEGSQKSPARGARGLVRAGLVAECAGKHHHLRHTP